MRLIASTVDEMAATMAASLRRRWTSQPTRPPTTSLRPAHSTRTSTTPCICKAGVRGSIPLVSTSGNRTTQAISRAPRATYVPHAHGSSPKSGPARPARRLISAASSLPVCRRSWTWNSAGSPIFPTVAAHWVARRPPRGVCRVAQVKPTAAGRPGRPGPARSAHGACARRSGRRGRVDVVDGRQRSSRARVGLIQDSVATDRRSRARQRCATRSESGTGGRCGRGECPNTPASIIESNPITTASDMPSWRASPGCSLMMLAPAQSAGDGQLSRSIKQG